MIFHLTQQPQMQTTVESSAAEKQDSADAEIEREMQDDEQNEEQDEKQDDDQDNDDVKQLQKKLAQMTKTMRDTNARNEQLIHDLQKRAPTNSKFASSKHNSQHNSQHNPKFTQIASMISGDQKSLSETQLRHAVPKVEDITMDQENLKIFRQQLRLNAIQNLAATVVRFLGNHDSRRQEKHNLLLKLHSVFENLHFVMVSQCRSFLNYGKLYQPLSISSSMKVPLNMTHTIENYQIFELYFYEREKTFVHAARVENERDMESFLRYTQWCKNMTECKEDFYGTDLHEKTFFAVIPYCEWQDFPAAVDQSEWLLKCPSKWRLVREAYTISMTSQRNEANSSIISHEASNSSYAPCQDQSIQYNGAKIHRTLFLQVDSMHATSLMNLVQIGDKQMLWDFEKHYFIEYGKFGVNLQRSNWAWFELDLLRASQHDINFLIDNNKLSPCCKHITYEEHLQIIISKPNWLGKQFIPFFKPEVDIRLLTPPKHAVKEINLKIAHNDLNRENISLYLLEPLGFMQWPTLSNTDATSKTKHLLFKQFAVGLHHIKTESAETNTAKKTVRYIHVVPMIEVKFNGAKRFAVDMHTLGNVPMQLQKIADLKIQFLTMPSCSRALETALVDTAGCIWMQLDLFNETQNSGGLITKSREDLENESSMRIIFQNLLIAAQYAREVSVLKLI